MPLKDDEDDILPSQASEKAFTRADHGKAEELKKHIKAELGAQKAAQVRETELKSQVNLQQLQDQLAGKQDEETRRKKDEEEQAKEKSSAPKTKTLKETEQAAVTTAHDTVSADTLIEQAEREKDVSDEESQTQAG